MEGGGEAGQVTLAYRVLDKAGPDRDSDNNDDDDTGSSLAEKEIAKMNASVKQRRDI